MLKFLELRNSDGAAGEEFPYDFWALINLWSDKELLNFIISISKHDAKVFCSLLVSSAPVKKPKEYFRRYYPMTLKEIEKQ